MKLKDLLKTMMFQDFYVYLEQDIGMSPLNLLLYGFEKSDLSILDEYDDYVVTSTQLFNCTFDENVYFVITITGQKIV